MDKIDLIISRIDRLEKKVDQLIEFKYKIIGATCITAFTISVSVGAVFKIL